MHIQYLIRRTRRGILEYQQIKNVEGFEIRSTTVDGMKFLRWITMGQFTKETK